MGLFQNGDALDQPTFHKLYEQTPEGFHAELIEGVVFVASPVSDPHAAFHAKVMTWLGVYEAFTPGVLARDHGTLILDVTNEYQPDATLRISEECGGQARLDEKKCLIGAPELCVEVAYSSAAIDLHAKKRVYARTGVREYVAVVIREERALCYERQGEKFVESRFDETGVWKSRVFPGLWLMEQALMRDDGRALLETLQEGIATPEHTQFCERLAAGRSGGPSNRPSGE
jgi:hypothetical protein